MPSHCCEPRRHLLPALPSPLLDRRICRGTCLRLSQIALLVLPAFVSIVVAAFEIQRPPHPWRVSSTTRRCQPNLQLAASGNRETEWRFSGINLTRSSLFNSSSSATRELSSPASRCVAPSASAAVSFISTRNVGHSRTEKQIVQITP
jgi:hypothetical protein